MEKMTDVSSHEGCSHFYQHILLCSCKIHPSYGIAELNTYYDLEFDYSKDIHLSSSGESLLSNSSHFHHGLVAWEFWWLGYGFLRLIETMFR